MSEAIDLSRLPDPQVIDQVDYEQRVAEMKAALIAKDPTLADVLELESEPATKILQVAALFVTNKEQEFNDRAKGLLLALANGSDLDHIGVTYYYTERLVIDPGDPTAVPPIDPVYESDEDYIERLLIEPDTYSTAGPAPAYRFHAMSADGNVKGVGVTSPAPVEVVVSVLSRIGDGTADQPLLDAVAAALSDDVRPLTDQVTVQSVTIQIYTVNATLILYPGIDEATVMAAAEASLAAWTDAQHLPGRDITVSGINAALRVEGVHDVVLNDTLNGTDITASLVIGDTEAAYCSGITVIVGGVGE